MLTCILILLLFQRWVEGVNVVCGGKHVDQDLHVAVSEVAASPTSMTGEEDVEDIEDEDEEKTREQEEEVEEKYKDEHHFFRPKSESPLHQDLDS